MSGRCDVVDIVILEPDVVDTGTGLGDDVELEVVLAVEN